MNLPFVCPPLNLSHTVLKTKLPALLMSIVNLTPDSFWAKSRFYRGDTKAPQKSSAEAAEYILAQFEAGADIVDIGGESTRPGSLYISAEMELERIIPVIEEVRRHSQGVLSIDTRKLAVMREARRAGADMLNDISALEDDSQLAAWAAKEKIPVILMHKRGTPVFMQENTRYTNAVDELALYLADRVKYAISKGIEAQKIILDAGIGFGKDTGVNTELIRCSGLLLSKVQKQTGQKIDHMLMALSRKSCIGEITGQPVEKRLAGSLAANMFAVYTGATMLRVHDTAETVDMLKILQALAFKKTED